MTEPSTRSRRFGGFGPAIIIASVVFGPGSLLASSRVGAEYGYQLLWLLALASGLMITMTALAAYIGAVSSAPPCELIARRWGRPLAIAIGLTLFTIITCFQASNNIAVLASLEGLWPEGAGHSAALGVGALLLLNGLVIATLFGAKSFYQLLEKSMMVLVGIMLAGFAINLFAAGPSLVGFLSGLVPSLPAGAFDNFLPRVSGAAIADSLLPLQGLLATTLSVAGAFYQSYLVRDKGWGAGDWRRGVSDSLRGIAVLGLLSAMIMCTSAAALHGRVPADQLKSAGDVAQQLTPLFGRSATMLFAVGIFAAAFSSFLGNALVGGCVLADSLGKSSSVNSMWAKLLTVLALAIGMTAAIIATAGGGSTVTLILFAQALTVVGTPALAVAMLWLAKHSAQASGVPVPRGLFTCGVIVLLLVSVLALRTGWRLGLQLWLAWQ